jgi:DNA invertase Pin-like site-specific DNA recombinase
MYHSKASSVAAIAKTFGISRPTVYKCVKEDSARREKLKAVI